MNINLFLNYNNLIYNFDELYYYFIFIIFNNLIDKLKINLNIYFIVKLRIIEKNPNN